MKVDLTDKLELEKIIYQKGYREGFEGALKLVYAIAYRLKYEVLEADKVKVQKFIDDLIN